jgi:hypothetical protein
MQKARIEHVFLVRVWREPGPDAGWRGCIDHVASGKREYFSALGALVGCIEDRLSAAPAPDRRGVEDVRREGPTLE